MGFRWFVCRFTRLARVLFLCATLVPISALAQGAAPASSEYEVALSSALEAHARGEYEAARMFLERAHAIEPSARTFRGLGIVAFAQKRHFDAIRLLDQALASEVKPLPDDMRKATTELLSHAWAQVGRIEIELDPPSGDFLVDGQAPDFYSERTVVLTPGSHTLTARAQARAPYELTFDVKPGDRRTLQIVLAVPPPPEVVEKVVYRAPEAPPARPTPEPTWYTPRVRWTAVGVGSVLLVGSATLWGIGYAQVREVDRLCRDMDPSGCTRSGAQARLDTRHVPQLAISSAVLGAVGAATLLTVGALELWKRKHDARDLEVRAGALAFELRGRF